MMANLGHYDLGYEDVTHRGVVIRTIVGNQNADKTITQLDQIPYKVGYIPAGYEYRPDLIANLFFNSVHYYWFVALVNNFTDVFEDFTVNTRLKLPNE